MSATPIDYASHGFRNPGFGCTIRQTEISVHIVVSQPGIAGLSFGVYIYHGSPGGQFWRNYEPLVRVDTMEQALAKAEAIFGIAGSGQFAVIHQDRR